MVWRFRTLGTILLLIAGLAAEPALAQESTITLWDQHVASAMTDVLVSDDACLHGPFALYRQTCVGNELNITLERSPFERLTLLDRLALVAYNLKHLHYSYKLAPATKLRFETSPLDLAQDQEAKVRISLRMEF